MSTSPHFLIGPRTEVSGTTPVAFVARVADMRETEDTFQRIKTVERVDYHEELPFLSLLTREERTQLQRLFPSELTEEPVDAQGRIRWDTRARELVKRMLDYADRITFGHMRLAYTMAPDAPEQALILTASGSMVELMEPEDDLRRFRYHPGLTGDRRWRESGGFLQARVRLGERLDLGTLQTTQVTAIAVRRGLAMPEGLDANATLHPDELVGTQHHFRSLLKALRSVTDAEDRRMLEEQIVGQATALQRRRPQQGHRLMDLIGFISKSGDRYQVRRRGLSLRLDVIRTRKGLPQVIPDVTLAEQAVVAGAPLCLLNRSDHRIRCVIDEVEAARPR